MTNRSERNTQPATSRTNSSRKNRSQELDGNVRASTQNTAGQHEQHTTRTTAALRLKKYRGEQDRAMTPHCFLFLLVAMEPSLTVYAMKVALD